MMENRDYLNNLFDIYQKLLTDVEIETFKSYYFEDLSLSEIALNRHISKSSVGKTLKQVTTKLTNFEDILHLYNLKADLTTSLHSSNLSQSIINIIDKYF